MVSRGNPLMRTTHVGELIRIALAALFGGVLMSMLNMSSFLALSTQSSNPYILFDPVQTRELLEKRLETNCTTLLPTQRDLNLGRNGTRKRWNRPRYVMYHNLVLYLQERWAHLSGTSTVSAPLQVLDVSGSMFLEQFTSKGVLNVTKTSYPDVDVHRMPFKDESFDVIAADQVFEHIAFPHQAMLEMHRLLRRGGIGIITTIAYNPIHMERDYWRFNTQGLLALSVPFRKVPICGSWGVAGAICTRAKLGLGPQELQDEKEHMNEQVQTNEPENPFSTWIIVEK